MIIIIMHKPESVLENETHKILWDFEIQTDHLIPTRKPDLVQINKKKKKEKERKKERKKDTPSTGFCHFGWPQSGNKRKRKD